LTLSFRAH